MIADQPHLTFFCELEAKVLQTLFSLPDLVALGELNASISLGILDFSAERAEVVRRLNDAGVPVIAWLLLPKEHGYWLNLDNCDEAARCYDDFQVWTAKFHLEWAGVGLDVEPDIALVQEFMQLRLNRGRLIWRLLRRMVDIRKYRRARQAYKALLRRIRADGYRVESYQLPFIVDERKVRSGLLQRAIGIFDIPTDKEVLILYTSFVRPYGPGLIWSYAAQAQAIAVGSTGGGVDLGQNESQVDIAPLRWEEFARDLRLAWTFTNHLYVFSLEGCVRQGFLSRLKQFEWDQPILEPADAAARVNAWRHTLDSALWIFSHPLVWVMGISGLLGLFVWLRRNRQ